MAPPTLVAAAAESCRPLTGGGREATFSVSFTGGDRWTLLPEDGPVSPLGGGAWKVVVDAASGSSSVTLRHVKVGGGSPFTTAVLPLPASMVATTAC